MSSPVSNFLPIPHFWRGNLTRFPYKIISGREKLYLFHIPFEPLQKAGLLNQQLTFRE